MALLRNWPLGSGPPGDGWTVAYSDAGWLYLHNRPIARFWVRHFRGARLLFLPTLHRMNEVIS